MAQIFDNKLKQLFKKKKKKKKKRLLAREKSH